MKPYFTSKRQKERCIRAIEDSIAMWRLMLDVLQKENVLLTKPEALRRLWQKKPCPLHEKHLVPMNHCFLCQYVNGETVMAASDEEYDIIHAEKAAGMLCNVYCPAVWSDKNLENMDTVDDDGGPCAPCEALDTFYGQYANYGASEKGNPETILWGMVCTLEQALAHAKALPIKERTDEI